MAGTDGCAVHAVMCMLWSAVLQDAMLREFQDEIARLKAQLAERQQQGSGSGSGGSVGSSSTLGGSPDKAAATLGAAARGGAGVSSSSNAAVDARAAAIRRSMRAELERQLRQAVTVEALAKARQDSEQQARCGVLHCSALLQST